MFDSMVRFSGSANLMVPLSMTLSDPTPVSRSRYSLKANISQTVHPIHYMSGSRQGFSGSVDPMELFAV